MARKELSMKLACGEWSQWHCNSFIRWQMSSRLVGVIAREVHTCLTIALYT